jgi:hypothetical protein
VPKADRGSAVIGIMRVTTSLLASGYNVIICIITGFLLSSCNSSVSVENYASFFNKNIAKYTVKKEAGNKVISITYCPPEMYAAREMEFDTTRHYEDAIRPYLNNLYFTVAIQGKGAGPSDPMLADGGPEEYTSNMLKNTFLRDNDFCIVCDADTFPAMGYSFDRSRGVSKGDAYTVTFKSVKDVNKCRLLIRNISVDLGTIDIKLGNIVKPVPKIRRF